MTNEKKEKIKKYVLSALGIILIIILRFIWAFIV